MRAREDAAMQGCKRNAQDAQQARANCQALQA
jgi:hypothetical protein